MKLTKKLIKQINDANTNCSISDEGDYYSIYVDNPCCEDFTFEINKGKDEVEEIISYCEDFDPGEHFKLWYGANRGEPSDPSILMNNCYTIANSLNELASMLR